MKLTRAFFALSACLVLASCSQPSPAETYRQAISTVEGVAEVEVEYARHAGMGDSTDVEIVAEANDHTELQRILDESLRAFIESADEYEETSLNYLVYSQDRSVYLTPSDLGTVMGTLSEIREHYGVTAD